MIFRIQSIIGAAMLFQTLALGGAKEVEDEAPERELMPFHYGYGDGYGYTTGNNRYSSARARGDVQGSAFLRPYDIGHFQAYNPERNMPRPSTKSRKGGRVGNKAMKMGKSKYYDHDDDHDSVMSKASKGGKAFKASNGHAAEHDPLVRPARGRSYLNSMHWERIPGQPIFVSNTDVPIIVLDEQPTVVVDSEGNTILTDTEGNEILITVDEQGNPTVTVDTVFEDPDADDEDEGGRR